MTDSLSIRINLSCLSASSRSLLAIGSVQSRHPGQRTERFCKRFVKSPMSGAGMTLLFMQADRNPHSPPDALVADLNLPSALVGQNYTHETNVWCAADHGLKLLKIVLAQMGVPADELDEITLDHVTLDSVTLTYIYQFADREAADAQMAKLSSSLRSMLGDKLRAVRTVNRTLYVEAHEYKISLYNKTTERTFAWPRRAPRTAIQTHGQRLIRLEVKLTPSFLKKRGLHLPDAWRRKTWESLYKDLFDETVGKTFRLKEQLRQKYPRLEALTSLAPKDRQIVDDYLAGGDPRQHLVISVAARRVGAFSKYRLRTLKALRLDIDIPWSRHMQMRHYELRQLLEFPPRYRVDKEVAEWSYCKANANAINDRLDAALEDANERYKINPKTSVRDRLRNILDEED